MTFLKCIPIIAMLLVAIFKDHLPEKLRLKRPLRTILVTLLLIAALFNIGIIIEDDHAASEMRSVNRNLNFKVDSLVKITIKTQALITGNDQKIAQLLGKLEPFIQIAAIKYPDVHPDSALSQLREEIGKVKEIVKPNAISYLESTSRNVPEGHEFTVLFKLTKDIPIGELRFTIAVLDSSPAKILELHPAVLSSGVSEKIASDGKQATISFSMMQGGNPAIRILTSRQTNLRIQGNRDLKPFVLSAKLK